MKDDTVSLEPTSHCAVPQQTKRETMSQSAVSRRSFLGNVGRVSFLTAATGAVMPKLITSVHADGLEYDTIPDEDDPDDDDTDDDKPQKGQKRAQKAYEIRVLAAQQEYDIPLVTHPKNGDEKKYANKIGNFSKGLPHDKFGEVDLKAYKSLIQALKSGKPKKFDDIILGSPESDRQKLVNPQSAFAFDLEGIDSRKTFMIRP
ncbi:MAG: hypothetical protein JW795_16415, partial [Chitinivibrionales bacterium]|nr:hypothetical protein [Chitinivibrionales bacterium]